MRIVLLALVAAAAAAAQTPADRQRARIQNQLGWEHMRAEEWNEAARAFTNAIDIDRDYGYAYYGLGRAELARRRYGAAIDSLEKARGVYEAQIGRQFTNQQEAQRFRRDQILELDEQIRQLQRLPQTIQTADLIRQLQDVRRDLQDSIQRGIGQAIQVRIPAFVTLSLGSAYFRAGRMADAEREYKTTVAADPRSGEALSNLAVVYLETERYDEALKAITAAKKTGFKVNPRLEDDIRKRAK